ncbi:alanine--glyoxylate aminotransferase family protein [Candidatus Gottesmanbacteria bacterium]|nr:alanine--glyoxylate aminotransferase family protein [Candidatus Gottesmanbacteria bacterium]
MTNLRIPGPTPLPKEVLRAISRQVINHRGHEYEEMQARVTKNLQYFFQTKNDIFLLTSSGMGGLEAAISNFFSPGDTLVFFTCGEFGNRWAEIAKRFGGNMIHIKAQVGEVVKVEKVEEVIHKYKKIAGVFFTHNETATGVLNKLDQLIPLVKQHQSKPLILVDSISALGAVDLPMDKLGIDVLVTASQKAWMAPPGIAMIAVSQKAWGYQRRAKMPHYYFDLAMYKEFAEKHQTPATCAVSTIFGLDASLQIMKKDGRENIFKRHILLMRQLREGIRNIETYTDKPVHRLELFVDDRDASPAVTSIKIPEGIDGKEWLTILREKYHIELAGGMGETKGKIIRVAHMGYVAKNDIDQVLSAINSSLSVLKTRKKIKV